ncbi:MAG TPA: hypothetical protein VGS62_02325 [Streptosporangiaceae bacterium]|nr:hypothetical protein [Streptosporangiaceae bacterium]
MTLHTAVLALAWTAFELIVMGLFVAGVMWVFGGRGAPDSPAALEAAARRAGEERDDEKTGETP